MTERAEERAAAGPAEEGDQKPRRPVPRGAERIVLWRHGQTDDNVALRLQGQIDNPLNDRGREQAEVGAVELARRLRTTNAPVRLVSSDLLRARDTAAPLGRALGLDVELDAGLRERSFGPWEGMTHAEIAERWPEQFPVWRAGRDPDVAGIETRAQAGARVGEALVRLAADTPDGATLVAVAHGAAISLAVTHLFGLDPAVWAGIRGIDNCHWAVLRPNGERDPRWALTAYNVGA